MGESICFLVCILWIAHAIAEKGTPTDISWSDSIEVSLILITQSLCLAGVFVAFPEPVLSRESKCTRPSSNNCDDCWEHEDQVQLLFEIASALCLRFSIWNWAIKGEELCGPTVAWATERIAEVGVHPSCFDKFGDNDIDSSWRDHFPIRLWRPSLSNQSVSAIFKSIERLQVLFTDLFCSVEDH